VEFIGRSRYAVTQRFWQLHEAKNKFSKVVDEALTHVIDADLEMAR
jgi:hypothetical protein